MQPLIALAFAIVILWPGPAPIETAFAAGLRPQTVTVEADVVYGHKLGMALTLDVFHPPRPTGAGVIFINSGGFVSGQLRQCAPVDRLRCEFLGADELAIGDAPAPIPLLAQFSFQSFLEAGFTVFDLRHGSNPLFTLEEIVSDVREGLSFVHENAADFGIDPSRIGLWGASAGGYLAALLATSGAGQGKTAPVAALAVYYPAGFDWVADRANYPELFDEIVALHLPDEALAGLSLKAHLSADDPPTLIIYGAEDFPFIVGPSQAIGAGLEKLGVETKTIVFPDTGHEFRNAETGYDAEYGAAAQQAIVEWFEAKLVGR